jgi:pyruvate formate lyase activating enzyme
LKRGKRLDRYLCEIVFLLVYAATPQIHPAYKLTGLPPTPLATMEAAAQIADEEGMQYVHIGNYPGHERKSTFCPACGKKIISRVHFSVLSLDMKQGRCLSCGHSIPVVWWDA